MIGLTIYRWAVHSSEQCVLVLQFVRSIYGTDDIRKKAKYPGKTSLTQGYKPLTLVRTLITIIRKRNQTSAVELQSRMYFVLKRLYIKKSNEQK
jgi:hypothetical protein